MIRFNDIARTRYSQYLICGFCTLSDNKLILCLDHNKEYLLTYEDTDTMNKDIELLDEIIYTESMEEVISRRDALECAGIDEEKC